MEYQPARRDAPIDPIKSILGLATVVNKSPTRTSGRGVVKLNLQ